MEIPKADIERAFQFGWPDPRPEELDGLTVGTLGRIYADYYPREAPATPSHSEPFWVWELMNELARENWLTALECILNALRYDLSPFQASCIAAGPLEDIIAFHGPEVIGRIEVIAHTSARFRYVLSGVWNLGEHGEVWQRVQRAVGVGPIMDHGVPVPPVDL